MSKMANQVPNQVPMDVTIIRVFDAPRELVWKAWSDAKLLQQWWGPKYFTNPVCEVDFRPGGKMLIHMQGPDGVIYPDVGYFREIVEPERIVFISSAFEDETGQFQLEVLNTAIFKDLGDKTELTMHAEVLRASPEVMGALAGMEEGWSQSFDKLADLLSGAGQDGGKGNLVIDAEKREIVMKRVFDAPRELVFQVTTDPKLVPQWWGPRNLTTVVDRMDVRPGGAWRHVQHDESGNEYAFNGIYREVVPPERLVFTFEYEGMPGHELLETILFEEHGGKTTVTTIDHFQTVEDLYGMVQSGMEEGATESMDRLTELLQEVQKEARKANR